MVKSKPITGCTASIDKVVQLSGAFQKPNSRCGLSMVRVQAFVDFGIGSVREDTT
jgi:hypothetical protein